MFYIFGQIIFGIFLFVFASFFVVQFYNIVFRGFAPFISTRKRIINKIVEALEIKNGDKIYELGCGKASFLRLAEKKNPQAQLTGIEYAFWPYIVAKIQISFCRSKIKIKKENIFKTDISQADIVYCFLNVKTMVDLEKKFMAECKPGARIVSFIFTLPNKQPEKVLDLGTNSKVYFYKM